MYLYRMISHCFVLYKKKDLYKPEDIFFNLMDTKSTKLQKLRLMDEDEGCVGERRKKREQPHKQMNEIRATFVVKSWPDNDGGWYEGAAKHWENHICFTTN